MALLSLGTSLSKLFPSEPTPSLPYTYSPKFLSSLESLSKENPNITSPKTIKKLAYLCNYQFKKNDPSLLSFCETILETHLKQLKSDNHPIKESFLKLYPITLINLSISYEKFNLKKAMNYLIKAIKFLQHQKFKSAEGKVLIFIAKLKESELCIYLQKYDLGIECAQTVLNRVLIKLQKPKDESYIKTLAKIAINAFHKIAVCEEARGLRSSADVALDSAERIRESYLPNEPSLQDLEHEMNKKLENFGRKSINTCTLFTRKSTQRRFTSLKTTQAAILKHFTQTGFVSDRAESPQPEFPPRYYSAERLKELEKIIDGKTDPMLLNTDKFYFNHIFKGLQIETISKSPEKIVGQIKDHIKAMVEAKDALKTRKKICKPPRPESTEISKKVQKIEEEFEAHLKTQDVRLHSQLKTRVYQKLLKNINWMHLGKRTPPAQALVFRPPPLRRVSTERTQLEKQAVRQVSEKRNMVDEFKKEIEDQLEEIFQDFRGVEVPLTMVGKAETPGKLAVSTVKPKKVKIFPVKKKRSTRVTFNGIFKTEVSFK